MRLASVRLGNQWAAGGVLLVLAVGLLLAARYPLVRPRAYNRSVLRNRT